jgi:hypothetical protein
MTPGEITAIVVAATAAVGTLLGYFRNRYNDRVNERKLTSEAQQTAFAQNIELNRYIDGRVDHLVGERIEPVKQELQEERATRRRQMGAVSRILRSIANQLPPSWRPTLDASDIAEVEEMIPQEWLGKGGAPERS